MDSNKPKSLTVTNNVDAPSKADILSIIKACHKSGVKNFKIHGLELTFTDDHVARETPTKLSPKALEGLHYEDKDIDNDETLSMLEAQLMVEDPSEWERQAASGAFTLDAKGDGFSGT